MHTASRLHSCSSNQHFRDRYPTEAACGLQWLAAAVRSGARSGRKCGRRMRSIVVRRRGVFAQQARGGEAGQPAVTSEDVRFERSRTPMSPPIKLTTSLNGRNEMPSPCKLTRRAFLATSAAALGATTVAAPFVKRAASAEPLRVGTYGGYFQDSFDTHVLSRLHQVHGDRD